MFRIAEIYSDIKNFQHLLERNNIGENKECFVKIFTANMDAETAVNTAKDIKDILPNAKIVGASSAVAVVVNGEQYDNETLVIVDMYDSSTIKIEQFCWENKSPSDVAKELHDCFKDYNDDENLLVHLLVSDLYPEASSFIAETNKFNKSIKLVGGLAGAIEGEEAKAFVFTEQGLVEKGMIAFCTINREIKNFVKVSTSMDIISQEFEITNVEGISIKEIENQNSLGWLYNFLGISNNQKKNFFDWNKIANEDFMISFPLILDDEGLVGRFVKHNSNKQELNFFHSSTTTDNTKFRIGYLNPRKTIQECYETCGEIIEASVEYLFSYACFFRKIYINNCAKWEIKPFAKYNVCGMYLSGEISNRQGLNYMHNGANVLVGIAEHDSYIIPDIKALEDIELIETDIGILHKAKEKEIEYLKSESSRLVEKINSLKPYKKSEKFDYNFNLPNYYQFEQDREKLEFNKICLVENQTADTNIAFAGQEMYYAGSRDILEIVKNTVKKYKLTVGQDVYVYALNYKTFIVTIDKNVSDSQFVDLCQNLYDKFAFSTSQKAGISGVLRFAVVLEHKDLIEVGLNAMVNYKNTQDNFFVIDKNIDSSNYLDEEVRVIELISRAIKNNLVVPYYQGIHNNETNEIDRYEALMRIVDEDGTVYTPFVFMDIAKRYKYYGNISRLLIEQVFEDFKYSDKVFSVNVSLYDIQSYSFRTWFIKKIKNHKKPENVIVELVESENYKELDILLEFTKKIKKLGAKLAIDDFGSGYSTLATIIKLDPDYIKIDGGIIGNLMTNEKSIIVLDTIKYFADRIEAKTIAEFVENKNLQYVISSREVDYSQGYLFAKPCPLEEIM